MRLYATLYAEGYALFAGGDGGAGGDALCDTLYAGDIKVSRRMKKFCGKRIALRILDFFVEEVVDRNDKTATMEFFISEIPIFISEVPRALAHIP